MNTIGKSYRDGGVAHLFLPRVEKVLTLDSTTWYRLPSARLVDSFSGAMPQWSTDVRAAWSEQRLWFHFVNASGRLRATMTRYKDKVWKEDAVEVYLQQAGSELLYEFQLSPIGTVRDLRVRAPGDAQQVFDDSWCCSDLVTSTVVDRDDDHNVRSWRALLGIPWKSVGLTHRDRSQLRLGLFRIERDPEEYSALRWADRAEADLHDPRLLVAAHLLSGVVHDDRDSSATRL